MNLFSTDARLYDVPTVLRSSNHFQFLIDNIKIIDEATEKKYIDSLKRYAVYLIEKLNTGARFEWKFIDLLLKYLQESYDNVAVVAGEFHRVSTKCTLKNLIILILNLNIDDEIFKELKEVAKYLRSSKEEYLLENEILDIVEKCIKPAALKTSQVEGRWVIEVTGKYILLSEIKAKTKEAFTLEPRVEEVRFVGVDMLYIDADLSSNIWHGKNVVVYSNQIKIMQEVTWIISGNDSSFGHNSDAGTDENGEGVDGSDGYSGESGGNLLVITDQILNASRWKIVSNGGKGSVGQNGGNGRDGPDGKGMEMSTFRKWGREAVNTVFNGTLTLQSGKIEKNFGKFGEMYKEFEHPDGFKIYSCIDQGYYVVFLYHHSLRLVKGTDGKAGGSGGSSGFGGEGGFKGEVEFHCKSVEACAETTDGFQGPKGMPGFDGLKGKDGYDIGVYWTMSEGKTYYGDDRSSKYCLEQFPNRNGKRVFNDYYRSSTNPYTGIVSNGKVIQQNASNKERTTKSVTRENHLHAKASRKKKPIASQIKNRYSNLLDEFLRMDASKAQMQLGIESDKNDLRKLQGAAVCESTSAAIRNRCKRIVPVKNTTSSLFCKRRSDSNVMVEKKLQSTFPHPSWKERFHHFMSSEISFEELTEIQEFIEINENQCEKLMNILGKTLFCQTKNEHLNHFACNTAMNSAALESFMTIHLEFLSSCRIYFDAFENELIRHNADLLPSWVQSQQSQWLAEEFEKKITQRHFLAKLYHRMKNFQKKKVPFTQILKDPEIRLEFGRFAVRNFPSYSFNLFEGFKKIDYLRRVLIEKRKIAALKVISAKMETTNHDEMLDEMYSNEENYLKMEPFHDDIIDHVSLGRIHKYFIENHSKNREKLASFVGDTFKDYNKNCLNSQNSSTSHIWQAAINAKNLVAKIWTLQVGKAEVLEQNRPKENYVKSRKLRAKIEETNEFQVINFIDKLFLSPMLIFLSEVDKDDDEIQKFRRELSELSALELNFEWAADVFECSKLVDELDTFRKQLFSMMYKNIVKKVMKVEKIQGYFVENILHNGVESKTCRSLLAAIYEINLRIFKLCR